MNKNIFGVNKKLYNLFESIFKTWSFYIVFSQPFSCVQTTYWRE